MIPKMEDDRLLMVEMKMIFEDTQVLKLRFHLLLDGLEHTKSIHPAIENFLNKNYNFVQFNNKTFN